MAKRELSSTLRNLKFMQRVTQKEEKAKVEEEEEEVVVLPNGNFPPPSGIRKCVVIMEGDPHPEATRDRMSFQNFNPTIDKLNEEPSNSPPCEAMATESGRDSETRSDRGDVSPQVGIENLQMKNLSNGSNGELKRKPADVPEEALHPHKSQKNSADKNKREKLDWNVLRPSKHHNKRK